MFNEVVLVGRLVVNPQIDNNECNIMLAVNRNFKNEDGIYETDFIPVILTGQIAKNCSEYCKKEDMVAVRGRIQRISNDETLKIVVNKLSFLSSRKEEK